jgi:hypothetical protein
MRPVLDCANGYQEEEKAEIHEIEENYAQEAGTIEGSETTQEVREEDTRSEEGEEEIGEEADPEEKRAAGRVGVVTERPGLGFRRTVGRFAGFVPL